jgi:hypothetical protein
MSYIGSTPTTQSFIAGTDYFNGTGSATAFTLSRSVVSVNDIQAVVNNVVQVPNDAYTVFGTTITFTSAPSAGTNNIYVRYLSTTTQSITPSQGTVGNSQFANNISAIPMTYGTIGAGDASFMKNRIINGAMVVSQRYGTTATANTISDYTLDRWIVGQTTTGKLIAQQNAGSVTPPVGFSNYLGVTSQSAFSVGTSSLYYIQQAIEGFNTADLQFGTANAKTVTLSFWVNSSLTGSFGGCFYNNAANRYYPYSYTINSANTWEQKTVTIAGDTTGTWVGSTNGAGLWVFFSLGCGTSLSGTAGAWANGSGGTGPYAPTGSVSVVGTSGATFYITGCQLEVGSSSTGFEYVNYQTSLANCQRYYWRKNGQYASGNTMVGAGMFYNSTDPRACLANPVTMRATPAITFSGAGFGSERATTFAGTIGTPVSANLSPEASLLYSGGTGTTAGTAGQGTFWYITDNTSYIAVNAEL